MNPKQRQWSSALYDRACEFHGHGGPFLVIGLKMGLIALNHLDADGWFDLSCDAYLSWSPPDSCVIDGIQMSTGCTMGKRNIVVHPADRVSAVFHAGSRSVEVVLMPEIYEAIKGQIGVRSTHGEVDSLAKRFASSNDRDLFVINDNISTA